MMSLSQPLLFHACDHLQSKLGDPRASCDESTDQTEKKNAFCIYAADKKYLNKWCLISIFYFLLFVGIAAELHTNLFYAVQQVTV